MSQVRGSNSNRLVQLARIGATVLAMLTTSVASAEITGGAAFSAPEPAPPGYATLVIYRTPGSALAGGDLDFYVNETLVTRLGRRCYTYVYIKEGPTSARFVDPRKQTGYARVVAVPGETYFLKWTRTVQILVLVSRTSTGFGLTDPSAARTELQDAKSHYGYVEPLVRTVSQNAKADAPTPETAPAAGASTPNSAPDAKQDDQKGPDALKQENKEAEGKK